MTNIPTIIIDQVNSKHSLSNKNENRIFAPQN